MNKPVNFTDIPRDEMKDMLIQGISGNEHEQEMYLLISTFTAYNLKDDLYLKYFDELETDEIIDNLNSYFYGETWEEEDIAWECAYETLGEKLLDITDYFDEYMRTYLQITQPLENLLSTMLTIYTKI